MACRRAGPSSSVPQARRSLSRFRHRRFARAARPSATSPCSSERQRSRGRLVEKSWRAGLVNFSRVPKGDGSSGGAPTARTGTRRNWMGSKVGRSAVNDKRVLIPWPGPRCSESCSGFETGRPRGGPVCEVALGAEKFGASVTVERAQTLHRRGRAEAAAVIVAHGGLVAASRRAVQSRG